MKSNYAKLQSNLTLNSLLCISYFRLVSGEFSKHAIILSPSDIQSKNKRSHKSKPKSLAQELKMMYSSGRKLQEMQPIQQS